MVSGILKYIGFELESNEDKTQRAIGSLYLTGPAFFIWYLILTFFPEIMGADPSDIARQTPEFYRNINFTAYFALALSGLHFYVIKIKKQRKHAYLIYQFCSFLVSFLLCRLVLVTHGHELFVMCLLIQIACSAILLPNLRLVISFGIFHTIVIFAQFSDAGLTASINLFAGTITLLVFMSVDIAYKERLVKKDKELLKTLADREELYRSSVDGTGVTSWRFDLKTNIITGSPEYFAQLGLSKDLTSIEYSHLLTSSIHEADRDRVMKSLTLIKDGMTIDPNYIEYRRVSPDGKTIWVAARARLIKDQLGNPIAIAGSITDITERKLAEFDARNSRERLEIAMKIGNLGAFELSFSTKKISTNGLTKDIYGLSENDLNDTDDGHLATFFQHTNNEDREHCRKTRDQATAIGGTWNLTFRLNHPAKGIRWINEMGQVFLNKNNAPVRMICIATDITENISLKEQLQEQSQQLIQSAQLSSLGEMAAGIAHEINTPTAAIRNRAEGVLLRLSRGKDPKVEATMKQIIDNVDRCTGIISTLKVLARHNNDQSEDIPPSEVAPLDVVNQVLSLCRLKLSEHDIHITVSDNTGGRTILGVTQMLSQVVLNLINNAVDAVMESGLNSRSIDIQMSYCNDKIKIFITDSGSSIPSEIREKIFVPFFTTKAPGKGTGLGLSLSKKIMQKLNGDLILESTRHTTFVVIAPAFTKVSAA